MPRSKAYKESKVLLKTILNKSLLTMEAKSQVPTIFSLVKEYCRLSPEANESEIEKFLSILQQVNGDKMNLFKVVADDDSSAVIHVRNMLYGSITKFLSSIETALPHIFSALNSIDWLHLFGIEVASSVPVTVTPPSDDDSGDVSMDSPSIEIKSVE